MDNQWEQVEWEDGDSNERKVENLDGYKSHDDEEEEAYGDLDGF